MYTKNFGTRLKNGSFSLTVICKGNKVILQKGRRMMKHQVIINVEKADGEKVPVVQGAIRYLPRKKSRVVVRRVHTSVFTETRRNC